MTTTHGTLGQRITIAEAQLAAAIESHGPNPNTWRRVNLRAACLAELRGQAEDHRAGVDPSRGWHIEHNDHFALIVDVDGAGIHRVRDHGRVVELARLPREKVLAEVALRDEVGRDLESYPTVALVAMAGQIRDGREDSP